MRLCLACHQNRLATLLDTATHLVLLDLEEGGAHRLGDSRMAASPALLAEALAAGGADALVCGGVSCQDRTLLEAKGVRVIPWLCGSVEEVAAAFLSGDLTGLLMAGCPRCRLHRSGFLPRERGRRDAGRPGLAQAMEEKVP